MIPKGSVVDSFLFFSGELEFKLSESGRFMISHTCKMVIYEFWRCAVEDSKRIAAISEFLYPFEHEKIFYIIQENWPKYRDHFARSALFFILNRCSETGNISSGRFNDKNYNSIALSYLKKFNKPKNFFLQHDKTDNLIKAIDNTSQKSDYILLPIGKFSYNLFEYGKSKGYEITTINHKELNKYLNGIDKKWIVLYKKHPQLFQMYKQHNITMIDKYGRKTDDNDKCEDLIIANF
jgi:hypothetical protein